MAILFSSPVPIVLLIVVKFEINIILAFDILEDGGGRMRTWGRAVENIYVDGDWVNPVSIRKGDLYEEN